MFISIFVCLLVVLVLLYLIQIRKKGDCMELFNKFPSGFFEKTRPEAPKKKSDIIPIKWSKKVTNQEKKAIISLAKKKAK